MTCGRGTDRTRVPVCAVATTTRGSERRWEQTIIRLP